MPAAVIRGLEKMRLPDAGPRFAAGIRRLATCATLVMVVAGCSLDREVILSMGLEDGRILRAVAAVTDTAAVLLYAPGDCLTCGSPVSEWFKWADESSGRAVSLILTGTPTPVERRNLIASRVGITGTLDPRHGRVDSPRAYVVVRGELADSAIGRHEIMALMTRLSATTKAFRP